MKYESLQIAFNLDGRGFYWDAYNPIHLDGLIGYAVGCEQGLKEIEADDEPDEYELPLKKWNINGVWGWHASALITPEINDDLISIQFYRKKFRENKINSTSGTIDLKGGVYREYNVPLPLLYCDKLNSYAFGNKDEIYRLLKTYIKAIGKKRKSRVLDIEINSMAEDFSCIMGNKIMRHLPKNNGTRFIRPRPPYWNNYGRVNCCDVGIEAGKDYKFC